MKRTNTTSARLLSGSLGSLITCGILLVALAEPSFSQELSYQENIDYDGDGDVDEEDLARAAQNPVADLISLPFQNNTIFGFGPFDRTGNLLNIQPVIPANLSSKVNLISRAILPVVTAPDVTRPEGTTWGLGDLVYTAFFSPAKPSALIWGAGPVLQIPTGTSDATGSGKWGAGPSLVLLGMPGRTVLGVLVNNIWSYAGSSDRADVNQMLIQYFVNYNFQGGWFLTSAPIITSNWELPSHAGWVVPFGIGGGRVFPIGRQPVNVNAQFYYNAITPETEDGTRIGPEWSLRVTFQFLFPKG
jgi:hypothetical protein